MKRALFAYVGLFAIASASALAADLPPPPMAPDMYKAPPVAAPPSWTGCYINGGGGGTLMSTNQNGVTIATGVPTSVAFDSGGQGWFGVAGGGCDYQFQFMNWNVVAGAFGDYDFMSIRGTTLFNTAPVAGGFGNVKENAAWAGGLRLGILVAPSVLVYSTGGYTGTHFDPVTIMAAGGGATGFTLGGQNLNGWFLGGGTETSLSWIFSGLFLRTEYRYSDFQSATNPFLLGGVAQATGLRSNTTTQSIFTQLVWRFNFSGSRW